MIMLDSVCVDGGGGGVCVCESECECVHTSVSVRVREGGSECERVGVCVFV